MITVFFPTFYLIYEVTPKIAYSRIERVCVYKQLSLIILGELSEFLITYL